MRRKWLLGLATAGSLVLCPLSATATTIDPAADGHRYGWGENIGWGNFRGDGTNSGIAVRSDAGLHGLEGYAWMENAGWVNFGNGLPRTPPFYGNTSGSDFGVNLDTATGTLSGWAWGENIGWINFEPAQLQGEMVQIDTTSGTFTGRAWCENVGWLCFTGVPAASQARTDPSIFPPRMLVYQDNDFTTATGWSVFAQTPPGLVALDHDGAQTALRARVSSDPTRYRVAGWMTDASNWMPYASVGTDHLARGKFYMYTTGQADPGQANTIPSVRMRLSHRYAVTSMLEVFGHVNVDSGNQPLSLELAPSAVPTSPSLYRVDLDPIDVPFLQQNGATEGVSRAFEAYAVDPQDNGYICLTESVIGTYPRSATPDSATPAKVYQASASDAGDLKSTNPGAILNRYSILTAGPGEFGSSDYAIAPVVLETSAGVTLDATAFDNSAGGNRIAIAALDIDPGSDNTMRVRVGENQQYHVRFHVVSTQQSNLNALLSLRARTIRYAWSQKLNIGGAQAAGTNNNIIAAQTLPGVGCQNPDKESADTTGGWYTLIVQTPMSIDIRQDKTGALAARMPNISAEPGPGSSSNSRRDLKLGFDMLDTLSTSGNAFLEKGLFTLDRAEVRIYDLVQD